MKSIFIISIHITVCLISVSKCDLLNETSICSEASINLTITNKVQNKNFLKPNEIQNALQIAYNFYAHNVHSYCSEATFYHKDDPKCDRDFQQMLIGNLNLNADEVLECCSTYEFEKMYPVSVSVENVGI